MHFNSEFFKRKIRVEIEWALSRILKFNTQYIDFECKNKNVFKKLRAIKFFMQKLFYNFLIENLLKIHARQSLMQE